MKIRTFFTLIFFLTALNAFDQSDAGINKNATKPNALSAIYQDIAEREYFVG